MTQRDFNPYVGPRPFERNARDVARFFGRSQETKEITSLIFGHPVVLVYAQSGAGKTSLFNTSIALTLENKGFDVLPLTRVGGVVPNGISPHDVKNLYVFNALLKIDTYTDPQKLLSTSLSDFLGKREMAANESGQPHLRAIIFDQFEELFTYTPMRWHEQRIGFFHQVAAAIKADPLLRVVFVIREDFLAELDPYARHLPERLRIRYRLERLGEGAALRAIKDPLANTSRRFASGVAEELVRELLATRSVDATGKMADIEGQYVEPVQLQVVCVTLWSILESDVTEIQHSHLSNFDVNDALSIFYDSTVEIAARDIGVLEGDLREWFGKTLITAMGTRSTAFRGGESTGGIDNRAVDFLESRHIIRAEFRAGARWYELTHDRLIDPIRESNAKWFEKNWKVFQRQTILWIQQERSDGLLLRGAELREAKKDAESLTLTTDEQQFLALSEKSERRRFFLMGVVASVVTILVGLSFFAIVQRNLAAANEKLAIENAIIANQNAIAADEQRKIAEDNAALAQGIEKLAREAQAEAERQQGIAEEQARYALAQQSAARAQIYQSEPGGLYTSTLLAIASWTTAPSDEANAILRKNISLLPIPVSQIQREGGINSLEFNTQGNLFVTAGADGNACVWKVSDGTMLFCRTSPKSVNDAVFSPNDKYLVTGDASGRVEIIEVESQAVVGIYEAKSVINDVDVSKNNEQIAVTRDDGKITLLELTGKRKYDLQASGRLVVASFNPDGRYISASSDAGVVTLWNLDTGEIVSSGRHRGKVLALAFSPDGKYLVTGGTDGYAVMALTSNGRELYRLLHEDWVTGIAFNAYSTWFATVSNDRRIRLWDTADGNERLRMSQDSYINEVKISPDGRWIATVGADKTVRVWNASTGTEMFQIPLKSGGTVLGFSGDGNRLVAGDATGEIGVWDISVMPAPENYLQFYGLAGDVQFSPSGDLFAASDGPRVWMLRTDQLSTLAAHSMTSPNLTMNGDVDNLAFSPDSVWLGVSTLNGEVRVYNWLTKQPKTLFQTGLTYQLAFTPDSAYMVTCSSTGAVEMWSLASFRKTTDLAAE